MERVANNKFHFIYGLEQYINWKYGKNNDRCTILQFFKKWYCNKDYYALRNLIIEEVKRGYTEQSKEFINNLLFNFLDHKIYTRLQLKHIAHTLNDPFCSSLAKFAIFFPDINLDNYLSKGQIESKIWLLDTLQSHEFFTNVEKIAIFGCWYNFLGSFLLEEYHLDMIRGFDIDADACYKADINLEKYVNNNWNYKSCILDVNNIEVIKKSNIVRYWIQNAHGSDILEETIFDLIINTSCEHMLDTWLTKLGQGQKVLLQTNNMKHLEEHINCCESLDHAIEKYGKYGEIIWAGSKTMVTDYERYMIILKTRV